jgi:ketosteroid isomerase-like protein
MSANLELLRSIYEASAKGDFRRTDWADPEIEYVIVDGPTPGRWRGPAEMARVWRDFLAAWEDLRIRAEEYRELDEHEVLVLTRSTGRGKTSGLQLPESIATGAGLFRFRDGKVIRHVVYLERHNALADFGLER